MPVKRSLCVGLAVLLAAGLLGSCSPSPSPFSLPEEGSDASEPSAAAEMARTAYQDLMRNFWTGDAETGHLKKEDHGYILEDDKKQTMIWAHTMVILALDTFYDLTGDEEIRQRIAAQWAFTKDNFNEEQLARVGKAPNIAIDDAGWDAMAYMLFYEHTGDPDALTAAGRLIRNSFIYWADGKPENGLWYPKAPPSQGGSRESAYKSLYSVGLLSACLDYYEATRDELVLADATAAYQWLEDNLLRDGSGEYDGHPIECDDHLYFCDYNEGREGRDEKTGPDGGKRPNDIGEAGSVCLLAGNMGMGVLHARLYEITGNRMYLERAVRTVRAVSDGVYNHDGVLVNDRDAWVAGTFFGDWVREVLPLPGIAAEYRERIIQTGRSAFKKARTDDGYYRGSWIGSDCWEKKGILPEQMMTSASGAHVVIAAALAEKAS